jgi:hypothetical protein
MGISHTEEREKAMKRITIAILVGAASSAAATPVLVEIHGEVEFNQIGSGELGTVTGGETTTLSFTVDSDTFLDSGSFPTRGYDINLASLDLSFSGGASLGANLGAGTSYFTLRDNDPAVDGFYIGHPDAFPTNVPLDQIGIFGDFGAAFSVTYGDDPLPSLDILDAVGSYDFTGLTVFNMTIDDGPFNAMGMVFSSMTITKVPAPSALMPIALAGLCASRRRRS